MRILIIEDDKGITSILQDFFSDKGQVVSVAEDGITGLHLAVVNDYDAIVLDLMLPGVPGRVPPRCIAARVPAAKPSA